MSGVLGMAGRELLLLGMMGVLLGLVLLATLVAALLGVLCILLGLVIVAAGVAEHLRHRKRPKPIDSYHVGRWG